jgi:hypothetical protein
VEPGKIFNSLVANAPVKAVTAAATLGVNDQVVMATLPTDGTYAITLPNVVDAAGRIYTIEATAQADASPGTVTVQDSDETPDPYTSSAITAVDGYCVVYSNGRQWFQLAFSAT